MISIKFVVEAHTSYGETVKIVGNHVDLGDWKTNYGLNLTTSSETYPEWSSQNDLRLIEGYDLEFKIVIVTNQEEIVRWEQLYQNRIYTAQGSDRIIIRLKEGCPIQKEIHEDNQQDGKGISSQNYSKLLSPKKIAFFPLVSKREQREQLRAEQQEIFLQQFAQDHPYIKNKNGETHPSNNGLTQDKGANLQKQEKLEDQLNFQEHFYAAEAQKKEIVLIASSQAQEVRLKNELKQLSKNLPTQSNHSIFILYDDQRMDVLRSVIFGAEGTPYAHGAFVFDIFIPDDYPQSPPKVQIISTKGGRIRFGPNLYDDGNVCLSLLGTWRGDSVESWNPTTSNLYQVLISIQSLVMNEDVFFNEPYYEEQKGDPNGELCNRAYSNIVRYYNLQHTINDAIEHPPIEFAQVYLLHFYIVKDQIRQTIQMWIKEADLPTVFDDLILDHNYEISIKFRDDPSEYKRCLVKEQSRFEQLISGLEERIKQYLPVK